MPVGGKMKLVVQRTWHAFVNDPLIVIALILTTISRLIYFTLPAFTLAWMLSIGFKTGEGSSHNAAVSNAKLQLVASIIALFTAPIVGFLSDRVPFDL
jgi:hypothetical protein